MGQFDVRKAQQKIIAVLARMVMLAPESVQVDGRYQDMLRTDPDALRMFAAQVEDALGVTLSDSALSAHPTIADLAAYCAQRLSAPRGGRLYVVLCKMPDGSTCERMYSARGHEKAAQLAMDDGAAAVLSVEREDAEDVAPNGHGSVYKVFVPLLWGILIGGAVFVFFWWRRGFEKFW